MTCIWPDCGHDTNQSDPVPGCRGKFCPKPQPGFIVDGLDAAGLVRKLSEYNQLTEVVRAACELYGFELVIDDEVATKLRAQVPQT